MGPAAHAVGRVPSGDGGIQSGEARLYAATVWERSDETEPRKSPGVGRKAVGAKPLGYGEKAPGLRVLYRAEFRW